MQHKTFYCLVIILSFLIVSVVNAENSSVVKGLGRRGLDRRYITSSTIGQIKVQTCPPSGTVQARKYTSTPTACSYDGNEEITIYSYCISNTDNNDNNVYPNILNLVVAVDSNGQVFTGDFIIPSYNYGVGQVVQGDYNFIRNLYKCDTDICAAPPNNKVLTNCITIGTDATATSNLDIVSFSGSNLSPGFALSCSNGFSSSDWVYTASPSGSATGTSSGCISGCCARFRTTTASTLTPKNTYLTGLTANTNYYLSFWVKFCGCGPTNFARCSFTVTIGPTAGTGNTYTVSPSTSNGCSNYAQTNILYNSGSSTTASYTFNVKNTATGGSSGTYIDSIIFAAQVPDYDKCKDGQDSCCSGIGNSKCT